MIYDLIIFDCDGTLVDSENLSNKVICDMLIEVGIPMTLEKAVQLFEGKSFSDITAYIDEHLSKPLKFNFENEFRLRSKIVFEKDLKPMLGAIEFIEALKIPFCIASNGPQIKMETTLAATGLDKYFSNKNTFSAYDINAWKPDPKLMYYSAIAMGCAKGKILVIEDTISGAMAAVNAKMDLKVYAPQNKNKFTSRNMEVFDSYQSLRLDLGF